jgi:hypothetical protein
MRITEISKQNKYDANFFTVIANFVSLLWQLLNFPKRLQKIKSKVGGHDRSKGKRMKVPDARQFNYLNNENRGMKHSQDIFGGLS